MTYESKQRNRRTFLKGVAATGIGLVTIGPASADEEVQYIVTGGNPQQLEREGFTVAHEITGANVYLVYGPEDTDPENTQGVDGAFEDFSYGIDVPASEQADEQEDLTDEQWDKELIEAFAAHETATGVGTRLGILDTGVDDSHPDLGNVDTGASRTFVGWEESGHTGDIQSHGTHIAGIAGADGAILGIAPDADLVSLRVLGETGGANVGDSFLALDYAAELSLDAMNMSIGSAPQPPENNQAGYRTARQRVVRSVVQRGTTVVTSAGNDATNLQQGGWTSLWGSLPQATSISATTEADELASFSNYSANENQCRRARRIRPLDRARRLRVLLGYFDVRPASNWLGRSRARARPGFERESGRKRDRKEAVEATPKPVRDGSTLSTRSNRCRRASRSRLSTRRSPRDRDGCGRPRSPKAP